MRDTSSIQETHTQQQQQQTELFVRITKQTMKRIVLTKMGQNMNLGIKIEKDVSIFSSEHDEYSYNK